MRLLLRADAAAFQFKDGPPHGFLHSDVTFSHDPGKGNALGLLVPPPFGRKSIGRSSYSVFSERLFSQSPDLREISKGVVRGFVRVAVVVRIAVVVVVAVGVNIDVAVSSSTVYTAATAIVVQEIVQQARRIQPRQSRRWHWQTRFRVAICVIVIYVALSLLSTIVIVIDVVPAAIIIVIVATTAQTPTRGLKIIVAVVVMLLSVTASIVTLVTVHITVTIIVTVHAPVHVKVTKLGLEVVPRSPGSAAVAKKGPAPDLNVQLVQVGWIVPSRLGAKGALSQHHMGSRDPCSIDASVPVVFGAVLENVFGRDVDGVVVFADKGGGFVIATCIRKEPSAEVLWPRA